jgi:nucleotide-binding universal stress UspA family protein
MNTPPSLTSLLVHADASEQFASRLRLALRLARQLDVPLDALYAAPNPATALSYSFGAALGASYGSYGGDGRMVDTLVKAETEQRNRAHAIFERVRLEEPDDRITAHWLESTGEPVPSLVENAWSSDLLVLGQHDPSNPTPGVAPSFVSDVLLASGKPAIVVPYIDVGSTAGRTIVIGWKPTPESARAVAAAVPLLRLAQAVHLAVWDEGSSSNEQASTAPIERFLHRHGVQRVNVLHQGRPTRELGELMLSLCYDLQADLLVMGCFSRSRMREQILGGVTRTILQSMTLPVLMSH